MRDVIVAANWKMHTTPSDAADLALTRDGRPVALPAGVTVTALDATTFRIGGLEAVTDMPGAYVLTVDAAGVEDLAGNAGVASPGQSIDFTVLPRSGDVTGPTIASITPIASPRIEPVATVDVTFSEALGPGTFTAADFTLEAVDAAGAVIDRFTLNRAAQQNDGAAPTVTIASPSSGAILSGTETIEVDADDDSRIEKVDLWVDGQLRSMI